MDVPASVWYDTCIKNMFMYPTYILFRMAQKEKAIVARKVELLWHLEKIYIDKYLCEPDTDFNFEITVDKKLNDLYQEMDLMAVDLLGINPNCSQGFKGVKYTGGYKDCPPQKYL